MEKNQNKKRVFVKGVLIFTFIFIGIIIGSFINSNESQPKNNGEYMTYVCEKGTLSFDTSKKKYYYSLDGRDTVIGNYICLDEDIFQLQDSVLKNKIIFFNNYEEKLKVIDLDNKTTKPSIWEKYDNEITIIGNLIE